MTKSPRKNVPDVGIELGATCMPSGNATDRAAGHIQGNQLVPEFLLRFLILCIDILGMCMKKCHAQKMFLVK